MSKIGFFVKNCKFDENSEFLTKIKCWPIIVFSVKNRFFLIKKFFADKHKYGLNSAEFRGTQFSTLIQDVDLTPKIGGAHGRAFMPVAPATPVPSHTTPTFTELG